MPAFMTRNHAGDVVPVEEYEVYDMLKDDEFYCVDGCPVEPDGTCEYGLPSLIMVAGLI